MKKQCDIILLSYESPDLLAKCVESVLSSTRVLSRLIIVDNASKDPGVKKYLDTVSGNDVVSVEKIYSCENSGFAGGMNKGIRYSTAPYICLLNNDCIVTNGWLREMTRISGLRKDIGIVNPQSNTLGSYPDHSVSLNSHAELLSDKKGKFVELGNAIGFAFLVKREVVDKIGILDEGYVGVCYEDTDYSIRAKKAGYISVMAEAAYVYHKEQASRKDLDGKEAIYAKNKQLFENKWGKLLRALYFDNVRDISKPDEIMADYDNMKQFARERVFIDMYVLDRYIKKDSRRCLADIVKHADIGVKCLKPGISNLSVFLKIFFKKKKYDIAVMRPGICASLLNSLRWVHKTRIFVFDEGTFIRSYNGKRFDINDPIAITEYLRKG